MNIKIPKRVAQHLRDELDSIDVAKLSGLDKIVLGRVASTIDNYIGIANQKKALKAPKEVGM